MLGGLQDAHGVHEPVGALLRDDEGQILVAVVHHGQVVAGVVHGDGGVAALHLLEDLVHDEGLIDPLVLGGLQKLEGLTDLVFVGGVHVVAQVEEPGGQGVPGVVDHQDLPGVLGIEHGAPAGDLAVHHVPVIDDAESAPGVGDGILVLRVVGEILEAVVNEVEVGDVVVVQLRQHVLLNETADHVVRGDDDVEVRPAHVDEGVEGLVALRRLVVDPDAGGLLELRDEVLVDILAPGADVHHPVRAAGSAGDHQRRDEGHGQGAGAHPLENRGQLPLGGNGLAPAELVAPALGPVLTEVDESQQQQHRHEEQGGDGVDLGAHPLFRHAVDGHGQGGGGGARREVADDEVIHAHGEGRQGAGDDAGLDLRQDHLPEGLHPGAAQVLGGVDEVAVHLPELGAHGEDDIGDVEADVGDEQGAEAHGQPLRQDHKGLPAVDPDGEAVPAAEEGHKEQAQGNARHDIRVHHGDVVHRGQDVPGTAAHGVEADGGEGPGEGGHDGGEEGDQERRIDALHDEAVVEELPIPVEGEALPDAGAGARVEGENDEDEDGRVEEEEGQPNEEAAAETGGSGLSHSITACSSPSPKRFIMTMQTTTMTIITREMAAPSWGS